MNFFYSRLYLHVPVLTCTCIHVDVFEEFDFPVIEVIQGATDPQKKDLSFNKIVDQPLLYIPSLLVQLTRPLILPLSG